ncbi:hypothetical protein SDC9_78072 [bioreactor metagenome]|uniref:Uncharacterized protein n=1 Tax=bioreactor metagenome TaxID=1076179 RepID=A0A644YT77_9ZZZZ
MRRIGVAREEAVQEQNVDLIVAEFLHPPGKQFRSVEFSEGAVVGGPQTADGRLPPPVAVRRLEFGVAGRLRPGFARQRRLFAFFGQRIAGKIDAVGRFLGIVRTPAQNRRIGSLVAFPEAAPEGIILGARLKQLEIERRQLPRTFQFEFGVAIFDPGREIDHGHALRRELETGSHIPAVAVQTPGADLPFLAVACGHRDQIKPRTQIAHPENRRFGARHRTVARPLGSKVPDRHGGVVEPAGLLLRTVGGRSGVGIVFAELRRAENILPVGLKR